MERMPIAVERLSVYATKRTTVKYKMEEINTLCPYLSDVLLGTLDIRLCNCDRSWSRRLKHKT